jgi:hypothetical protein
MVLLELLTAAPPAVAYPDRPKEYQFLVPCPEYIDMMGNMMIDQ